MTDETKTTGGAAADAGTPGPAEAAGIPLPGQGMPQPPTVPKQPLTMAGTLGEIVALLVQSPLHKYLFVGDLEWLVMAPMLLGQFRTYRNGDRLVGLALWAFVSEEVEQRLEAGITRLRPDEWKSGDRAWLIEVVAPFGGQDEMVEDLKQTVLRGTNLKSRAGNAKANHISEMHGSQIQKT